MKDALSTAKKEKSNLISVTHDDGDNLLQLYLGNEGEKSAFIYIGYEDKVYFTSEESTQKLRRILKK